MSEQEKETQKKTTAEGGEFDRLCEEAHSNARDDRARLDSYLQGLINKSKNDVEYAALAAEAIVRVSDCMAKLNAQVIQIAQLKLKSSFVTSRPEEDPIEPEAMYDQIGDPPGLDEERN